MYKDKAVPRCWENFWSGSLLPFTWFTFCNRESVLLFFLLNFLLPSCCYIDNDIYPSMLILLGKHLLTIIFCWFSHLLFLFFHILLGDPTWYLGCMRRHKYGTWAKNTLMFKIPRTVTCGFIVGAKLD